MHYGDDRLRQQVCDPTAYLVGDEPVKTSQTPIDGNKSIASPYFKGNLAYA